MITEIVISISAVDSANVFGVTSAGRLAKFDFEANSWVFKGASPDIIDIYAANNSKRFEAREEAKKALEMVPKEAASFAKPAKKVVKKKAKSSRGLA